MMAIGMIVSKANGTIPSWVHLIGDCLQVAGPVILGTSSADARVVKNNHETDKHED